MTIKLPANNLLLLAKFLKITTNERYFKNPGNIATKHGAYISLNNILR